MDDTLGSDLDDDSDDLEGDDEDEDGAPGDVIIALYEKVSFVALCLLNGVEPACF